MRYRRLGTRYALILSGGQPAPLEDPWPAGRLQVTLAQPRWRPPADVYETARDVTVVVSVAGMDQDDFEVMLYEDALVIDGRRRLPAEPGAVYHAAEIRQGPFRVAVALPAAVDPQQVEARYDQGLLRIRLEKPTPTDMRVGS